MLAKRPQCVEVPHVVLIDLDHVWPGAACFLRLDQNRQIAESWIVQQAPERLETEATLTEVLVSIDAAAARPLRVVTVKDLQPIEADDAIERGEGVAIADVGDDVVSGCDEVTRVEADADARRSSTM